MSPFLYKFLSRVATSLDCYWKRGLSRKTKSFLLGNQKSIYLLGAQCWPSLKSLAHAYSFFFKYMLHTVPFCRHSNTLKSLIPAHFTIDPVIKYRFLTMIFPFHFSDTTTPGQHCSRSK